MTAIASTDLHGALERTLDGHGFNREQRRRLFNPDPEVNSLAERIAALGPDYGVPQDHLRLIFIDVRAVLELNDREDECHRTVAAQLDQLTRRLHNGGTRSALTVKEISRRARPALATIRRGGDATAFLQAAWALKDLFIAVPRDRLLTPAVEHEIGRGPYRQLTELHTTWSEGQPA